MDITISNKWNHRAIYLFGMVMFFTFAFPSSKLMGFPFRDLCLLASISALLLGTRLVTSLYSLIFILISVLVLLVGVTQGVIYGFNREVYVEAKALVATITLPTIFLLLQHNFNRDMLSRVILKSAFYGIIFYFLLKTILQIFALMTGIDLHALYVNLFGTDISRWEFLHNIYRVQYNNDICALLTLFVLAYKDQIKRNTLLVIIIPVVIGIFLTMSRLLWGYLALLSLGYLIINRQYFIILLGSLGAYLLYVLNVLGIGDAINVRFSKSLSTESDKPRQQQIEALLKSFYEDPLFGKGVGSYNPDLLRATDEGMRYLYEVQWVSFLMKYGLLGTSVILVLFLLPLIYLYNLMDKKELKSYAVISCYLLFLLSGLTNPYLLTISAGALIVCILVVADRSESAAIARPSHVSFSR